MSEKVKFNFELEDGSNLALTYNLQKNSLKSRWCDQIIKRKQEVNSLIECKISNKTIDHVSDIVLKINAIIQDINTYYDVCLPIFKHFDQSILNLLHEEFERYGERHLLAHKYKTYGDRKQKIWTSKPFNLIFHENWMALNAHIHILENAIDSNDVPNFSCLIQYYPQTKGEKLTKQDSLFLTTDFDWGHLYLGYNTLGKDYMHTFHHNDVRVITNDQIKIQTKFSTEVFLNFSVSMREKKNIESLFWQWFETQSEEVKSMIPMNNPAKLALGRYYLGYIEFDETFLSFHNNLDDWIYGNRELQSKWNLEVFSKILKVIDIELIG